MIIKLGCQLDEIQAQLAAFQKQQIVLMIARNMLMQCDDQLKRKEFGFAEQALLELVEISPEFWISIADADIYHYMHEWISYKLGGADQPDWLRALELFS